MNRNGKKTNLNTYIPILLTALLVFSINVSCSTKDKSTENEVHLLNMKMLDQQEQINRLNNEINDLQESNNQKPNQPTQPAQEPVPPVNKEIVIQTLSAEKLYELGRDYFLKKETVKAEKYFHKFLETYPDHELADNALYWSGEIKYIEKKFEDAIVIYDQLYMTYPDENKAPDALLKKGYSYLNLNDKEKARDVFTQVIKVYPFSPAGTKAESILKQL